jgi:putative membrane protein
MIKTASLIGLLGIAIATALFAWQGLDVVLKLFASAGIGIFLVSAFHFVSMTLNARAWQILLAGKRRPSTLFFTWAVLLREAVNGLLPVARIGGEVATAKLLMSRGLSSKQSVASLVLDVTVSLGSQYVFTMIGIGLLLLGSKDSGIVSDITLGLIVIIPLSILFFVTQRYGLFTLLAKIIHALFGAKFESLVGGAAPLDRTVRRFYKRRGAVLACGLWQILGWLAGAGEVFLILIFMNHTISYGNAVIIESLVQALSSGAFVVPGALGVQEGGFVMIGGLVGLPADVALALSLSRRARDVLLFVPALLYAQILAGQKLLSSVMKI